MVRFWVLLRRTGAADPEIMVPFTALMPGFSNDSPAIPALDINANASAAVAVVTVFKAREWFCCFIGFVLVGHAQGVFACLVSSLQS